MGSFSCVSSCEPGFKFNSRTDSCEVWVYILLNASLVIRVLNALVQLKQQEREKDQVYTHFRCTCCAIVKEVKKYEDFLEEYTPFCEDLDECTMDLATCFLGASCVNTLGSYKCVCGSGYQEVDGVCEDIDECLSNGRVNRFVCGVDSECQNYPGSYRCVCKPGFKHRGRSCVDINECVEIPNICSHECVNLWGSYRCHCRQGYSLAQDSRTCEDIDECEARVNSLSITTTERHFEPKTI